mmetsp:Transcript_37256/g.97610  ORF Transcript_37256/g.97610 Transcript_37256/m.97610 type:complete len:259 (+) Transcript_37256:313-1089(+)
MARPRPVRQAVRNECQHRLRGVRLRDQQVRVLARQLCTFRLQRGEQPVPLLPVVFHVVLRCKGVLLRIQAQIQRRHHQHLLPDSVQDVLDLLQLPQRAVPPSDRQLTNRHQYEVRPELQRAGRQQVLPLLHQALVRRLHQLGPRLRVLLGRLHLRGILGPLLRVLHQVVGLLHLRCNRYMVSAEQKIDVVGLLAGHMLLAPGGQRVHCDVEGLVSVEAAEANGAGGAHLSDPPFQDVQALSGAPEAKSVDLVRLEFHG